MSSPLQRVVEGEDSENVSRLRLGCAQHVVSMTGAALNMKHPEFRSRSSYRAIPRRLVSDEDATSYTSLASVLGGTPLRYTSKSLLTRRAPRDQQREGKGVVFKE